MAGGVMRVPGSVLVVLLVSAAKVSAQVPVNCTPDRMPIGGVASVPGGLWRCINLSDSTPPPPPPPPPASSWIEQAGDVMRKAIEATSQILQEEAAERQRLERSSDGAIELRPFGNSPSRNPIVAAPVADPLRLEKPIGKAVNVKEPAYLLRNGSRQPLPVGTEIFRTDSIGVEGGGEIEYEDENGHRQILRPGGVFDKGEFRPGRAPDSSELFRGILRKLKGPAGVPAPIKTPFSTDAVRGTEYTLSYDEAMAKASGTLTVESGLVLRFDYTGRSEAIGPGQSRSFDQPLPALLHPADRMYDPLVRGRTIVEGGRVFLPMSPAGVWVDTAVWNHAWEDDGLSGRIFESQDKRLLARLEIDPLPLSADEVIDKMLDNRRAEYPDVTLLSREVREVGGLTFTRVRIGWTRDGEREVLSCQCFSGGQGVIRLVVLAREADDDARQADIDKLLNGLLVINPYSLPSHSDSIHELKAMAEAAERVGRQGHAVELYRRALDLTALEGDALRKRLAVLDVDVSVRHKGKNRFDAMGLVVSDDLRVVKVNLPADAAWALGFEIGDQIVGVNESKASDVDDFVRQLGAVDGFAFVHVIRGSQKIGLPFVWK